MASPDFHLDEVMAASLIANRLAGGLRRKAVRHLLRGCEACKTRVRKVLEIGEWTSESIFGELADIAMAMSAVTIDIDTAEGEVLWLDVERTPSDKRRAFLAGSPTHRTFGVLKAGVAACRRLAQQRPDEAVELANLLTSLAETVDTPKRVSPELRFDWRADAAVALAKAWCCAGDLQEATAALDRAEAFLTCGSQDDVDWAEYLVQRAFVQEVKGNFEESLAILDRAASLFRHAGAPDNVGKVLLHAAGILRYLDPSRALLLAEEGLTQIDHHSTREENVRAELSAHWTMAYCQAELGDTDEADGILSTYRYLIERQDEAVQVIFDRLTAHIRLKQNRRAEAEQTLRTVQEWYLEKGFRFDAVFTTIDLVELLVDDDRVGEALYVTYEVLAVLREWGLHRDILAIFAKLQEKLESAAATRETLRAIADKLRRTWHKNKPV